MARQKAKEADPKSAAETQMLTEVKENSKLAKWYKLAVLILLLIILAGLGFAAGIFLRIIDVQKLANDWKLAEYPIIGSLISKPQTNFEAVELPPDITPIPPLKPSNSVLEQAPPLPAQMQPGILTKEDIEKQEKVKKQEETKRISRLTRLYSEMKPDEAVVILKELDDNTVIAILEKMEDSQSAKILSLFEPKRAAKISDDMLKGRAKPLSL